MSQWFHPIHMHVHVHTHIRTHKHYNECLKYLNLYTIADNSRLVCVCGHKQINHEELTVIPVGVLNLSGIVSIDILTMDTIQSVPCV